MDLSNIKEIQIELTSNCNAKCPQCARNILGDTLNPHISLKNLSTDFIKQTFNRDNIRNIEKILFCGNLGDPCASPYILEILRYFKDIKNDMVIGVHTNGSLKTKSFFEELGSILSGDLDYLVFSIDGLEDTNHIYRRNTNFQKIIENAKAFISTGATAHWDMLVFEHNRHQVEECRAMAKELGFSWFRSKLTDRWDTYPVMHDLIPAEIPDNIDYNNALPICEKNRDSSLYLDHTGEWWPCCHMAEAHVVQVGGDKHQDLKKYSNRELLTEYQIKLDKDPFYVCKRNCGKITGKRSQWKTDEQLR